MDGSERNVRRRWLSFFRWAPGSIQYTWPPRPQGSVQTHSLNYADTNSWSRQPGLAQLRRHRLCDAAERPSSSIRHTSREMRTRCWSGFPVPACTCTERSGSSRIERRARQNGGGSSPSCCPASFPDTNHVSWVLRCPRLTISRSAKRSPTEPPPPTADRQLYRRHAAILAAQQAPHPLAARICITDVEKSGIPPRRAFPK
jgi:hypothetical protein